MKTVQQHFQEANIDDVVNSFLYEYPLELKPDSIQYLDCSCAKAYERYKYNIIKLIEKIKTTDPVSDGETWILFAHHIPDGDFDNIDFALVKASEEVNGKFKQTWAYEFTKLEEAINFYVADTYLTQYYINDLLASFLFEMSFFGWNQEELDETLDELSTRAEYVETHLDELISDAKVSEDLGIRLEERDSDEYESFKQYQDASILYSMKSFEIEEQKVIQSLRGNHE